MNDLKLQIHLAAWIIQDGNYEEFKCNQKRNFALEFWALNHLECFASIDPVSYDNLSDSSLKVNAEVVVCTDNWHAIYFGVRAIREQPPPNEFAIGSRVRGTICLGVDPYFYKEYLHKDELGRSMVYSWNIDRIQIETAPYIESFHPKKGKSLIRDPDLRGWKDICSTNAWTDDDGHAEYLLDVSLVDLEVLG